MTQASRCPFWNNASTIDQVHEQPRARAELHRPVLRQCFRLQCEWTPQDEGSDEERRAAQKVHLNGCEQPDSLSALKNGSRGRI